MQILLLLGGLASKSAPLGVLKLLQSNILQRKKDQMQENETFNDSYL